MRRCNGDRSPPTRRILRGVASPHMPERNFISCRHIRIAFISLHFNHVHSTQTQKGSLSASVVALHGVGPTRPVAVHHIPSTPTGACRCGRSYCRVRKLARCSSASMRMRACVSARASRSPCSCTAGAIVQDKRSQETAALYARGRA